MPPPPLNYERQPREGKRATRHISGRIVLAAWAIFGAPLPFTFFLASDDRSSLQFPAAVLTAFSLIGALALTAFHWLVLVPVLRYRNRRLRLDT